jgi:glycosyltransferase involved in cell wall biosynthesis
VTAPEISVVVPVRNGARYLPDLFEGLARQTLPQERFETVLVDDGSADETAEVAAAWAAKDPERRRVVPGPARGPSAARNAGIRAARGTWIASTDADIVPEPEWLEAGLVALERHGAYAVEGAIDVRGLPTGSGHASAQANLTGGRYMTGNMFYRRELVDELGGFDEQFTEQFLEDSDLAFRILDRGHDIPFARESVVRHPVVERTTLETLQSVSRLQALALFAAKHPERYRSHLRPVLRPLTPIDVDVLVGLAAASAAVRARGLPRVVLASIAAHGIRRGLGTGRLRGRAARDLPATVFVALAQPPLKAMWWAVGCVRFRRLYW